MSRVIRLRDVSTGKDREFVSSCTLLGRNGRTGGDVPQEGASPADSSPDGSQQLGRGGVPVGIGFSIFLFVIGAILTFALESSPDGGRRCGRGGTPYRA